MFIKSVFIYLSDDARHPHRIGPAFILAGLLFASMPRPGEPAETGPLHEARTNGFSELSRAYVALAIQGDLRRAPLLFEHSVGGGAAGAALRAQFTDRFVAPPVRTSTGDPAEDTALAYRNYWRLNLLRSVEPGLAEARLAQDLAALLQLDGGENTPDPESLTVDLLERTGWHYSVASTPPWRDLFVWKSERHDRYEVELTDQVVPVKVVFMDDFVVQGWKDFASLGLAATTGWVENGHLYCVAWAYDTQSENFAVSYLKHEARHLADLQRFPAMTAAELEYRAKLTELAFANSDLSRIWNDFNAKAANNPDSPHAEANWRVVRDMERMMATGQNPTPSNALTSIDALRINQAARRLLQENTAYHLRASASEAAAN